jgi:hypothetical protein
MRCLLSALSGFPNSHIYLEPKGVPAIVLLFSCFTSFICNTHSFVGPPLILYQVPNCYYSVPLHISFYPPPTVFEPVPREVTREKRWPFDSYDLPSSCLAVRHNIQRSWWQHPGAEGWVWIRTTEAPLFTSCSLPTLIQARRRVPTSVNLNICSRSKSFVLKFRFSATCCTQHFQV